MTQVLTEVPTEEQMTVEVRLLSAQAFDLARAYACGGDVRSLARRARALDAELARLAAAAASAAPEGRSQEIAGRCHTARQALTHLLAAPRLFRIRL